MQEWATQVIHPAINRNLVDDTPNPYFNPPVSHHVRVLIHPPHSPRFHLGVPCGTTRHHVVFERVNADVLECRNSQGSRTVEPLCEPNCPRFTSGMRPVVPQYASSE